MRSYGCKKWWHDNKGVSEPRCAKGRGVVEKRGRERKGQCVEIRVRVSSVGGSTRGGKAVVSGSKHRYRDLGGDGVWGIGGFIWKCTRGYGRGWESWSRGVKGCGSERL